MLWNAVQTALAAAMPAQEYELWIKPLICLGEAEEGLLLSGPDRYFCAWVEQRYLDLIRQKIREAGGKGLVRVQAQTEGEFPLSLVQNRQLRLPGAAPYANRLRSLHPAFTFDQFTVGESNRLAQSACKALALNDDSFGRCLFMNSETGLGKTHLTQAVVHQILRSAPATRLCYLTVQQFTAELVQGLRNHQMDQFTERYREGCDMLLLEDVHTLNGKTKTQEELNIVLDSLLKSGRRVIFTSALPPDQLEGLDADIKSRMTSGLLAGIRMPDFETRVRIIQSKMAAQGLAAHDSLAEYMAEVLTTDVRRMESAIVNIKARARLLQMQPDLNMVREILGSFASPIETAAPLPLSLESICRHICARFRVRSEDLRSTSRKREVVFPRQVAIYLSRKFTTHSLIEIGEHYRRDHSTVLHAIRTITQKMVQDTAVREQVELLIRDLQQGR